ncbi:DUF2065 domain-containing protein [Sulfuriflexus sp.]|jgi:uncharacterized protein YjeT (DUF2065 family)|uniref:DUF2065 domain-containing protein n=1 Tax=Sulfuriflexus sp. TaxID=2015443 RepID=UPI0028CC2959|nr:DUF2065 domain-containing protein [Sulfuriflexus sp.]MDT8404898.1 DUF2065 domain-containing protein [Sulfuriflexus sp.]
MWNDLFVALALVLVIEGILPFLKPAAMRELQRKMAEMDDKSLRIAGLSSMLAGLALLYLLR